MTEALTLPGVSPGVYGAHDFHAIAGIVYDAAGIVLPPNKSMLVYSRLAPLVRDSASATFSNYVELIGRDSAERDKAVSALTTNHTYFFRESHHFLHFAEEVRPTLLSRLDARIPVRMWSAGCSSGEETWSLALTMLGEDQAQGKRIARRDVRILASDIAPHALARASQAHYRMEELKDVPHQLRQHWTHAEGEGVTIGDEARQMVRFRSLNLQGDWPMKTRFDVIFCRNVMIYFDNPTKERLVARFTQYLQPGGYLYIGHSERATGPGAANLEPCGPTIYRRI